MTDGEGTERLWSFLRDFSKITKEMSPEKRIDTLTDGLLHYGRGIVKKLGVVEIFGSGRLFFRSGYRSQFVREFASINFLESVFTWHEL